MFMDRQYFLDYQVLEKYQLEVFWSWKEIIHPIGRLGTASRYDLLLENILNIVMLLPIGIFTISIW